MPSNYIKTESISDKHKRYNVAIEFWKKHPTLTRIDVCQKFDITESAMRYHMKSYKHEHPNRPRDGKMEKRKQVVRDAYNMALEKDMTATEAASWATKQHSSKIPRAEIQFYATKYDLPYLREADTFEMGKLCKYA
jgi:hypothetical protein